MKVHPTHIEEARVFDADAGFHSIPGRSGSFEVFWADEHTCPDDDDVVVGWYWWPCWPGCLPDGDACGPFETSTLAKVDAFEAYDCDLDDL